MKAWIYSSVFLLMISCSGEVDKILPNQQALTESVYASATVQPDSLYKVYAAVSGILDKVFVEEGDVVSKDKPLFQIINNTPKLNTQNAKFALDLAKENYKGNAAILSSIEVPY